MSDYVTWASCPRCGRSAAVGWTTVDGGSGAPGEARAVEFDCRAGCPVTLGEWEAIRRLQK